MLHSEHTGPVRVRWRARIGTVLTAAVIVALSACTVEGGEPSGPAEEGVVTDAAHAALDKAIQPFEGGLPTVSAPALPGKSVLIIPCSMAGEGCKRLADGAVEAADALGWSSQIIDPAGDPTRQVAALEQALTLKPDVVILGAIEYPAVKGTLEEVRAAGIKVIALGGVADPGEFDWSIPEATFDQGIGAAAYVAVNSKGAAKIALVELTGFSSTKNRSDAFREYLPQFCPDCEIVAETKYAITELATGLSGKVQSMLNAHPEADWVVNSFDGEATVTVPVVNELGRADQIRLISYDGSLQNLGFIRDGNVQEASYGQANEWEAWAAVYAANLLMQGMTPEEYQPGFRLITKESLPPEGEAWQGDSDFRAAYRELLGLG